MAKLQQQQIANYESSSAPLVGISGAIRPHARSVDFLARREEDHAINLSSTTKTTLWTTKLLLWTVLKVSPTENLIKVLGLTPFFTEDRRATEADFLGCSMRFG